MDYLVLGSNGFAQLGNPEYAVKSKIEMRILMDHLQANFPVPETLANYAYYTVKAFQHDFGTYHEIVIWYDDSFILNLENSEIESDQHIYYEFWDWANSAESVDLETEELREKMLSQYLEENPISETSRPLASKGPLHVAFRKAS